MKIKTILLSIILFILLPVVVYSAGVASPYSENIPLVMAPGQTHEFYLGLQNMVGNADLKFIASVSSGKEFLQITDSYLEYPVPSGSSDVKINLKVIVPSDAKEGTYDLGIEVKMVPVNNEVSSGMVQLNQGIITKIPLQIKKGASQPVLNTGESTGTVPQTSKGEKKGNTGLLLAGFVILVIILLIIFLYRKKK